MKKKLKIVVLPHTHWDREWYFTSSKSMIYSLRDFDEIIDFMENHDEVKSFILDGQTSIIEDYLEMHPDNTERLKELIKNKRILTGPWYTQPDTLVVSGESLIRNLLYGTKKARSYGHSMEVGYLPDSFGMSAQMPQIYNGFGIKYATFRRGIADSITKDREFYWESKDGSKVFAHNIYHYGSMAYPPSDVDGIKNYMEKMVNLLKESSTTGTILLFNGEDQKPIRKNINEIVEKARVIFPEIEFEIGSLEDTLKEMEKSDTEFITYQGEFTFGQHSRVHKSIFSTRADLKIMNNTLENFIVNILEPVSSLAYLAGFTYEERLIEKIWKLMLDNSAHDRIGMCNSDRTNRDVKHRFELAKNYAEDLLELKLREIGIHIDEKSAFQFQLYNLLPYKRDGYVEMELFVPSPHFEIRNENGELQKHVVIDIEEVTKNIFAKSKREIGVDDDLNPLWAETVTSIYKAKTKISVIGLPSMGYSTYTISGTDLEESSRSLDSDSSCIENEFYRIIHYENGRIDLFDKMRNKSYPDFISLEDSGDEGDSYDYSEPKDDKIIVERSLQSAKFNKNSLGSQGEFSYLMKIPYDLKERSQGLCGTEQIIKLKIELNQGDKNIHASISTINQAIEHRFRAIFHTDIKASNSRADQQFGLIERPVYLSEVEKWKEEAWDEKPRTIEPMQSLVSISGKEGTLEIITESVREYQIIGDDFDQIAMTLYRSTPFLGKDNLNDRPGRESGTKARTPEAELLGIEINSKYTIRLDDELIENHLLSQTANEVLTPIIGYQAAQFKNNTDYFVLNMPKEKNLQPEFSLLETSKNVVISTLKKAEGKSDLILRVFNPSEEEHVEVELSSQFMDRVIEVNLDETLKENPSLNFAPCQVKGYLIPKK
ncbi:MAG: glycoside hydrolase family 38 C-terminal domain-containing protein [Clostridiaceae bacterium]